MVANHDTTRDKPSYQIKAQCFKYTEKTTVSDTQIEIAS